MAKEVSQANNCNNDGSYLFWSAEYFSIKYLHALIIIKSDILDL